MGYKIFSVILFFPLLTFSQNGLSEEDEPPIHLYDADVVIPSFPPVYLSGFRFQIDIMYWEKPQRVGIYRKKLEPLIQGDEVALELSAQMQKPYLLSFPLFLKKMVFLGVSVCCWNSDHSLCIEKPSIEQGELAAPSFSVISFLPRNCFPKLLPTCELFQTHNDNLVVKTRSGDGTI